MEVVVASAKEIPVGKMLGVEKDDKKLLVVNVDGKYRYHLTSQMA